MAWPTAVTSGGHHRLDWRSSARSDPSSLSSREVKVVAWVWPVSTWAAIANVRCRLIRHHSAVGLVDRLQTLGLLTREPSPDDARQVLLRLTAKGERILHRLSLTHHKELEETGPKLVATLRAISRKNT